MDIKQELETVKQKREKLVENINQLANQRQILLQEVLRMDGEIRMLERLSKDGNKKE